MRPPVSLLALLLLSSPASPARADDTPDDPFVLTLSGGVSLGTYQAGQTWALLSYLRAARSGALPGDAPLADLRPALVGVTGASAGGINALAAAVTWCLEDAEAVDDNLLRSLWIDVGLDLMLPTDAGGYLAEDGLLSRTALQLPVERLRAAVEGRRFRPGCALPVALTVTRATPARVRAAGLNVPGQRAVVPLRLAIDAAGRPRIGAQHLPASAPRVGELLYLTEQGGAVPMDRVVRALQASSAVPVVFSPMPLEYCAASCPVRVEPPASGACAHLPDRPVACRGNFVDGGIFDNVPLGLARVLAEAGLDPAAPHERPITYVYVEPANRRRRARAERPPGDPPGTQRAVPDHVRLGRDLVLSAGRSVLLETVRGNRWNRDVADLAWATADVLDPEPPVHGATRRVRATALAQCLGVAVPRPRAQPCAEALGVGAASPPPPPDAAALAHLAAALRTTAQAPPPEASLRDRLRQEGADPDLAAPGFRRLTARGLRLLAVDLTRARAGVAADDARIARALSDTLFAVQDALVWPGMLATDPAVSRRVARLAADAAALEVERTRDGDGRAGRRVRLTTRLAPVVGDALFNFAAFLDRPLRRFDYAAGVYDGAQFVAEYACLHADPYAAAPPARDAEAPLDALDPGDRRTTRCVGVRTGEVLRRVGALDDPYVGRVVRALGRWEGGDADGWGWTAGAPAVQPPPTDAEALKVLAAMVPGLDPCTPVDAMAEGELDFEQLVRRLRCLDYDPQSRAMSRAYADPAGWWNQPIIRLLERALRLERVERDAAPQETERRASLEASVTGIEAANYAVRRYIDAPATWGFGTTSAPTATVLTALLPYGLDFDISRGGVGARYEAWWRPVRPFSLRLLATPYRFRREDSWTGLTLAGAGHLRSPALRTFGLGPAVFRNWDRGDDAAWSWGVEGYLGVIVGILRVGGGYRHLPEDSGGDTFFLNLGVSDFNALTRLVLLL